LQKEIRMIRLTVLALVALVLSVLPLQAQSIDKWQMRIYLAGAAAPITPVPTDFLFANVSCALPTAPVGSTINPNKASWSDPVTPTAFCLWLDPGTGVLNSLPFGAASYEATLT